MEGGFYTVSVCLGWDINSANLAEACERAAVLDVPIQDALRPQLAKMRPRPSIYCPDFIAANQESRANNVLKGTYIHYACFMINTTLNTVLLAGSLRYADMIWPFVY